jgi:hypothetical protein
MPPDQHPRGLSERYDQVHRDTEVEPHRHVWQKEAGDNHDQIVDADRRKFRSVLRNSSPSVAGE